MNCLASKDVFSFQIIPNQKSLSHYKQSLWYITTSDTPGLKMKLVLYHGSLGIVLLVGLPLLLGRVLVSVHIVLVGEGNPQVLRTDKLGDKSGHRIY